jgi:predicted nucleotidyltransferase
MLKEEILGKLQEFPHFDKLRFAYLYSSSARGDSTSRSDIDIALYYDIPDKRELHTLLFRIRGSLPEE